MMKRVLITEDRGQVQKILDQIPFRSAYWTGDARTRTDHYMIGYGSGRTEAARVTHNYSKNVYTVRLQIEDRRATK